MVDEYDVVRVTKIEYLPAVVYECRMCNYRKAILAKTKTIWRRMFSNDVTVTNVEDLYEPVGVPSHYCPNCRQRLIYNPRGDFPVVFIFGRDQNGQRRKLLINDFEPDFYVRDSDLYKINSMPEARRCRIKRIEGGYIGYDLLPISKIVCYLPSDVHGYNKAPPSLRDEFPFTYQADVLFENKVWTDLQIRQYIRIPKRTVGTFSKSEIHAIPSPEEHFELHTVIYDIETKFASGIDKAKEGDAPIYSNFAYSNFKKKFYGFFYHPEYKEKSDVTVQRVRNGLHQYAISTYCPICHLPHKTKECPDCNVPLTSLTLKNPKFANFLVNSDIMIVQSENEIDMLKTWLQFLHQINPDVLGGHNSMGFDDPASCWRIKKLIKHPLIPVNTKPSSSLPHLPDYRPPQGDYWGILPFDWDTAWLGMKRSKNISHGLNDVAAADLEAFKYDYDDDIDTIYRDNIIELLTYNLIDVALVVGYDQKMKP